ncbi:MAG: glycosyltransferase family 2 protein [Acidobacteriota bacterium]|nr:glycosyltransferase family 2 protein [Acidobacteriota bacterium]
MKPAQTKLSTEDAEAQDAPELSIFLPVLNEEENLRPMHSKIQEALKSLGKTAEVIYIDDGSTDDSLRILKEIAAEDEKVRLISLRRNYGQTAAMSAGIDASRGRILIPMDADLQNDPQDIARLLEKLNEGYDVVSGWRKNRRDNLFSRRLPSQIANKIISWIGGVPLHDYGCSLKAYRREVIREVRLYGEMHRFIPIYASWAGGRVAEIPVEHHARARGKSKYGISRTVKVVFDLMTIKFMASYQTKPIYVFGTFGTIALLLSIIAALWAFYLKFVEGVSFILTPLPIIAIVLLAISVQFFLMGLLAEMLVRTYHESQNKAIYTVREKIGFDKQ